MISNSRGETIITVLVAAGIGAIVVAALTTQIISQARAQKYLAQKYELMDLKQSFLIALQNSNVCTCNLKPNAADLTDTRNIHFDASTWDDNSTEDDETDGRIELPSFKAGCSSDSPAIASAGQILPGTQTGLVVDKIKLKRLQPTDSSAPPGSRLDWQGIWEISFRSESQVIALKPLQVMQKFKVINDVVNSPETNRRVDFCEASNFGGVQGLIPNYQSFNTAGSHSWEVPAGVTKILVEAWGGGGGGSTNMLQSYASIHCQNNYNSMLSAMQGNGGGGGGYSKSSFIVSPGDRINFYVGNYGGGGTGSCAGPTYTNSGHNGENTTFLTLVASGGGGAIWGCQASGGSPGLGGSANIGEITNNGGAGSWGGYWGIGGTKGGAAGGAGGGTSSPGTGVPPGGGASGSGSGACSSAPNGAPGRLVIYW